LFVTEKTVKFHLTNIYKKMNVKSRAQLIVWCLPHLGFVEKDEKPAAEISANAINNTQSAPTGATSLAQGAGLRLVNPGLDRKHAFATHTIQVSFQYVKPGENARAHRHTPAALRFVVQGNGAYTTVNGQQCIMEPGDLILTPKLTWHDHSNDSKEPMLWLDGLDFPLVTALHQVMQERYPERRQPIETNSEEVIGSLGSSVRHGLPPADYFHYKWRDTEPALRAVTKTAAARDRFDGFLLDYRNPATGGPTMTTIQCAVQLLSAKQETDAHRHTSTVMYHVFRGSGATQIGAQLFNWKQGDTFVVPLWHMHRHSNASSDEAILFSMSDAPALKALDLYREEC
jgi:gentisate 1,2-dioxygenase